MRNIVGCALVAVATLTFPALAAADTPEPATPAPVTGPAPLVDSLQGRAKEAYESAKLLVANQDFAGALLAFKDAYDAAKEPRLLFDMAVCEKNLRHYARMQALLQQYVQEARANLSAENRTAVEEALAAIKSLVATVTLTVNEEGATVLVDGESVGVTPLATPVAVDLGRHTVTVKKVGFDTVEKSVEAPGGSAAALAVTLVPLRHVAQLVVAAPDEATVFVDNKVVAKGRFNGQLLSGAHEVRVTEQGKAPYRSEVELRDGETRTLQVTLESERHGSAWPWLIGGGLVVVGGVVGGYFLFKPQDQTGAPPTGKLGSVQFASFGR